MESVMDVKSGSIWSVLPLTVTETFCVVLYFGFVIHANNYR